MGELVKGHTPTGALPSYISRQNYGYTLVKQREIKVATYMAKLLFNIPIPDCVLHMDDIDHNERMFCSQLPRDQRLPCISFIPVLRVGRKIKVRSYDRLVNSVRQVHEALEDATIGSSETLRIKRGWGADFLSSITGLASQDQLHSVQHALRRIEVGIHKASQMFGEGTKNLVAAFQVNHDRLNRVQTILGIYAKI